MMQNATLDQVKGGSMIPISPPEITPAGPLQKQRGIQLPQLLLSLFIVALFALLAVWWQASSTARTPVVALASDVEAGKELELADLTEIYISSDVPAQVTDAVHLEVFVGGRPITDLSAGTLLTPEMLVGGAELSSGQAFAGLILDGTRAPRGLIPGDRVQVLVGASGEEIDIVSPNALVETAAYDRGLLQIRLRLDLGAAQRVQTLSDDVVLIEIPSDEPAFWEEDEAPS